MCTWARVLGIWTRESIGKAARDFARYARVILVSLVELMEDNGNRRTLLKLHACVSLTYLPGRQTDIFGLF